MVVGPAMGGIIVSYELGRSLGVPAIFTERVDNGLASGAETADRRRRKAKGVISLLYS